MRPTLRLIVVPILAAPMAAFPAGQPTARLLDKPQVELAEPFTNVGTVRELSDGRVIVVDNGDRAVYVVDFQAGTSTQIGRVGSGPAEYRSPGILLAMAGDTTLLTDALNNRMLVIDRAAKPVGLLTDAWPAPSGQRGTRLPRAVDERGRGYFLTSGVRPPTTGSAVIQLDSVALVRATRGSAAEDSVGYLYLAPRRISTTSKDGQITSVEVIAPPFPAQDGWQAFHDGAVAIVRVRDYRVDWLLADGRRITGRPIGFEPVRVTDADKRGRQTVLDWPEFKPPFPAAGVLAGTDGRVWVQRHAPAGASRTHYDVIDRRGVVAAKVDVPGAGRIVGFGAKSIYVVRKDSDDLQYLQRFPL